MTDIFTRLKELWSKTTPGDWRVINEVDPNPIFLKTWGPDYKTVHYIQCGHPLGEGGNSPTQCSLRNITTPHKTHISKPDASFMAFAHNSVPQILAEVERLRAENSRLMLDESQEMIRLYTRISELEGECEELERVALEVGNLREENTALKLRLEKMERALALLLKCLERFDDIPRIADVIEQVNQILEDGK